MGPRLNPIAELPGVSDPLDPDYLIGAAWKQQGLSHQDIRDIAAFIIREDRFHQAAGLSPQELARSDVFWVSAAAGTIAGLTHLLSRSNMLGSHDGRPRGARARAADAGPGDH